MIFLPGTDKQIKALLDSLSAEISSVLIIGSGSEEIAGKLLEKFPAKITIVVEDNDSLLNTRLKISKFKTVAAKMMDFSNTDFPDSVFDLVYAQASISNKKRNKIVKEIKRILKPDGFFSIGEIVSLKEPVPEFVKDVWKNSAIEPLSSGDISNYYRDKNFEVVSENDFSSSLKEFYQTSGQLLIDKSHQLTVKEKSFYKKTLNQMSHESNVYLKLGGDAFIGFKSLLLKKGTF